MAGKAATLSEPKSPLIPRPRQISELYDQLLAFPNVIGCFVGHRRRRGRRTREVAVIACVSAKPEPRSIKREDRIPRHLSWSVTSRSAKKIGVDVQVAGAGELHGGVLGAGDQITAFAFPGGISRQTLGTIGIAMEHPQYGRVVTTAGHVFVGPTPGQTVYGPEQELEVSLHCALQGPLLNARARKVAITRDADYAIVSPPPGITVDNLYQDSKPLGAPYIPDITDLNQPAFVLGVDGIRMTFLRGIHGQINIGGLNLIDVLITDFCTAGGDSGGCLVTQDSRPMGLVEGATRLNNRLVSVFTSIVWPLVREQATTF